MADDTLIDELIHGKSPEVLVEDLTRMLVERMLEGEVNAPLVTRSIGSVGVTWVTRVMDVAASG